MKKTWLVAGLVAASVGYGAPAYAQQPTIPVIVKDTTSFYWQIVLAGARKAVEVWLKAKPGQRGTPPQGPACSEPHAL